MLDVEIAVKEDLGIWLIKLLEIISINSKSNYTYEMIQKDFLTNNLGDFTIFWNGFTVAQLRDHGLIIL